VLVGSGPAETHFSVHLYIITKRSGFFRAARSERWTTDKSKPADLHDYDPRTFDHYLHCLYHNAVPKALPLPESKPAPSKVTKGDHDIWKEWLKQEAVRQTAITSRYMELVRLYVVADRLADPTTANIVIDAIRRFSHSSCMNPNASVINFTFRSTTDNDGLRMLFADFYVYDDVALPNGDLPKEFLRMVVDSFLAAKQETDITVSHDHCKFFNKVNGSQGWAYNSYYQQVDVEDDSEDADDSDDSDE
jgi:hypothetical protein